jgi:glycosyltransferase involved in cell wall biosynthesis
VVIPAKNEARNIGWVLERIPIWVDEVVLIDGRSTDRTVEVALAIRPDIVVVVDDEPGKGAALRAGFAAATGDYIVMLDADGSMDPGEIENFVDLLASGHDLVKGSRFAPGGGTADMSVLRSAGNWTLLTLANMLFGVAHTDLCYGYAAFRRDRILELELDAVGFEIETQLFLRATRQGLRVTESPSFEAPRRFGVSNLNTFRDGWRVLKTLLAERVRPARPTLGIIRIETEAVPIMVEPSVRQVATMVSDHAYSLAARAVPASVEPYVE